MKILAFGDPHGNMLALQTVKQKAHEVDVVICLGDFTWFGEDLEEVLAFINTFPRKVIMIHGNHEQEEWVRQIAKQHRNIEFLHGEMTTHKDYTFIAYGGDGFSRYDKKFEQITEQLAKQVQTMNKTVLLLHGPPANTKLDIPFDNYHSGSHSYREFIEKHQPLLVLAGHVHECEKEHDMIGHATLFNPGPDGEILDLEVLHKQRTRK